MQDEDRGATGADAICGLEWVVWAMDAARDYLERTGADGFRLDYAHFYADELVLQGFGEMPHGSRSALAR